MLVTLDLDFSNVLRFPPQRYAGIVVLRVPHPIELEAIRQRVQVLLRASESENLSGRLWIVERDRIREYSPKQPRALPLLDPEPLYVLEVRVAGDEREIVPERGGGDPDVVLWYGAPFTAQVILDLTVEPGGFLVADEHIRLRGKAFDAPEVLLDLDGLERSEA